MKNVITSIRNGEDLQNKISSLENAMRTHKELLSKVLDGVTSRDLTAINGLPISFNEEAIKQLTK